MNDAGGVYGARLSEEEAMRRQLDIYSSSMLNRVYNNPDKADARAAWKTVRRQELDVQIDSRLGVGFPVDRREALWAVHWRLDRRMPGYLVLEWLWGLLRGRRPDLSLMNRVLRRHYGRVLPPSELEALLV